MNKQDFIQEKYGDKWDAVQQHVDDNGWIHRKMISSHDHNGLGYDNFDFHYGAVEIKHENSGNYHWRPKSLRGLETNNGWTKIESVEDLPSQRTNCWLIFKDGSVKNGYVEGCFFNWRNGFSGWKNVSHYMPIVEPKLPLY